LFFADTTEFNDFLLLREEINIRILELADRMSLRFAYPVRTFVQRSES
jgi:hypothetical protein